MQGTNRFLDFANEIMARHRGLGMGFEPAAMLYLEDQGKNPEEQAIAHQNYTTNLYHIQNIREENYLFKQNLTFLTQILENKMYQNLYPTVEKQIEHVIREEMPQAEAKVIRSVSEQLTKLVQQGGIEQFQIVREKIFSEYKETTKETEKKRWKEQEKLFRKIENIWNSSIYSQTVQKKDEITVVQNIGTPLIENTWNVLKDPNLLVQQTVIQNYPISQTEIVHPEIEKAESRNSEMLPSESRFTEIVESQKEQKMETFLESVLERTLRIVETQNQTLTHMRNQTVGNLGTLYKSMMQPAVIERIQESYTKEMDSNHTIAQIPLEYAQEQVDEYEDAVVKTSNPMILPKPISSEHKVIVNQESIHLEYPSEETVQIHQEMMELLHSEMQRIPEVPQVVEELRKVPTKETEQSRTQMAERTKTISQQILSRMESIIRLPVAQTETIQDSKESLVTKSVTKTVALNRLSHAILEYAQSEITSEQLQNNMLQILEDYRTELITIPGADSSHVIYNSQAESITKEVLRNKNSQRLLQSVINQGKTSTTVSMQNLEPAPIVYRSEDTESTEQSEKTKQLEQQVHEVVKTIKNVEEKTVVQKERILEEQRKVVQEILNESPTIWTEGKGAGVIRNEVQQSVEEQMNASVNQITNRVYRRLEEKLKSERGRRGLI